MFCVQDILRARASRCGVIGMQSAIDLSMRKD